MAGAWTAGGVAALDAAERRWPSARPAPGLRRVAARAVAHAGAAAVAVARCVSCSAPLRPNLAVYPTLLAGAMVLAACAAVSRPPPRRCSGR